MAMTDGEKKAYARGYGAGKKRLQARVREERQVAQRNAFWLRAYLAALPACIAANGWKDGSGNAITNTAQRAFLARTMSNESLDIAISEGRL